MLKCSHSNAKRHRALFLAGCFALGTITQAADVIYVVDISAAMQPACGEAPSRLTRARAWIATDAAGVKEKISVVAVGERARPVLAPSADPQELRSI